MADRRKHLARQCAKLAGMRPIVAAVCLWLAQGGPPAVLAESTPEARAVAHLVREVPAWARENRCFSCHNNGDGVRALLVARSMGISVPGEAIAETIAWLRRPEQWSEGAKHPMASDTGLARLQFAVALNQANASGEIRDRVILLRNAALLARQQAQSGAWHVATGNLPGSPITWGSPLATALAVGVLSSADSEQFAEAISRAREWLRETPPAANVDHAARLLAFPGDPAIHQRTLEHLLKSQTTDGGWGPQPRTPAECFDTAMVLLALAELEQTYPIRAAIQRARAYLISRQFETGGWPETTRPSGNTSYAHHVSTSAWAAMALLRTNPERN